MSDNIDVKKVGTCVVCKKDVIRTITYKDRGFRPKGQPRSVYNTTTCYGNIHCSHCGLMYQFPPPELTS